MRNLGKPSRSDFVQTSLYRNFYYTEAYGAATVSQRFFKIIRYNIFSKIRQSCWRLIGQMLKFGIILLAQKQRIHDNRQGRQDNV